MTRTHTPRIRSLRTQVDQLTARRAEHRSVRARSALWLDPAQLEKLAAQPWWRDEYQTYAASIGLVSRLVLEDGCRWGEVAEDVQWEDALAILDPNSPTP